MIDFFKRSARVLLRFHVDEDALLKFAGEGGDFFVLERDTAF